MRIYIAAPRPLLRPDPRVGAGCGQGAKRCRLCRAEADYLCDHCDAPLCGGHAREVSRSKHYCPDHCPTVETGSALCVCMGGQ